MGYTPTVHVPVHMSIVQNGVHTKSALLGSVIGSCIVQELGLDVKVNGGSTVGSEGVRWLHDFLLRRMISVSRWISLYPAWMALIAPTSGEKYIRALSRNIERSWFRAFIFTLSQSVDS